MTEPHWADDLVTLYAGDCLDVLRDIPDDSVDAVVTDPPYGLEFMGRAWDSFGQRIAEFNSNDGYDRLAQPVQRGARVGAMVAFQGWCEIWAAECLRVLKPGGHLLSFGGTRTWHRLAVAIEDAGFEMRDSIAWLYGSGFPKSLDVSKAIDKAAGATREVIGDKLDRPGYHLHGHDGGEAFGAGLSSSTPETRLASALITAPATPDAEKWQGWGTALKPAFEPIVVARKPLIGTVAANVLTHGTGALNIDATRVESDDAQAGRTRHGGGVVGSGSSYEMPDSRGEMPAGRWPTNVLLDGDTAAELDKQTGVLKSGANPEIRGGDTDKREVYSGFTGGRNEQPRRGMDEGGASRFYPVFRYEAKAPTVERPRVGTGVASGSAANVCALCGKQDLSGTRCVCPEPQWVPRGGSDTVTAHPTVKPLDLMRWLVRLVTPHGGVVLDPFAGSGTTAEACVVEGFRCITIEREASYLPLIIARLTKPIETTLFGDV